MRELVCIESLELCPEVALGVAGAEDRAAVLAHIERCAGCATELRSMTDVADVLVTLVPSVEPPSGFEDRVLDRVRAGRVLNGRPTLVERLRSRPTKAVAAVASAAVLALGGWLVGQATSVHPSPVETAALVSHHAPVGEVVLVRGAHPWISMTTRTGTAASVVRCQVRETSGRLVTLGAFTVTGGYGSWASPLPKGVVVRGARLVTPGGQVLASASFSAFSTG